MSTHPMHNRLDPMSNSRHGLIREFVDFVLHSKKFWLVPILLILGLFGVLMLLGGTAAAPFIYTLF